jgi:hypothetical protein
MSQILIIERFFDKEIKPGVSHTMHEMHQLAIDKQYIQAANVSLASMYGAFNSFERKGLVEIKRNKRGKDGVNTYMKLEVPFESTEQEEESEKTEVTALEIGESVIDLIVHLKNDIENRKRATYMTNGHVQTLNMEIQTLKRDNSKLSSGVKKLIEENIKLKEEKDSWEKNIDRNLGKGGKK